MDKNYPLVIVKWRDILAMAGWETAEEVDPIEVESEGWLCHDGDDVIKLGSTLGEDGEAYAITAFPRGCVLEITYVTPRSPLSPSAVQPIRSSRHDLGKATARREGLP